MNCRWCKDTGRLTLATTIVQCNECNVARVAEYVIDTSDLYGEDHLQGINPLINKLGSELSALYILAPMSLYRFDFEDGSFQFNPTDTVGMHRSYWFQPTSEIEINQVDNRHIDDVEHFVIRLSYHAVS